MTTQDTPAVQAPADRFDLTNDLIHYAMQTRSLLIALCDHTFANDQMDTRNGLWLAVDQIGRIEKCARKLEG